MSLFRALTRFLPFKGYVGRQLIALDQAFNALFCGEPDETISSRLGRADAKGGGFADLVCKALDLAEKDHCGKSIEADAEGNPVPHHLGRVIRERPTAAKTEPGHRKTLEGARS